MHLLAISAKSRAQVNMFTRGNVIFQEQTRAHGLTTVGGVNILAILTDYLKYLLKELGLDWELGCVVLLSRRGAQKYPTEVLT